MEKILAIMPKSIGGRLTSESIFDGFRKNGFEVVIFDELKDDDFKKFLFDEYKYIAGYDFSPVKLKIDYGLNFPCIAYFSDVIYSKTSGEEFDKYFKYLENDDIYVFYWDRALSGGKYIYQAHFVNCDLYKNFKKPRYDVMFAGRLDTNLRLETYLELNKKLPNRAIKWHAIKRHYEDALNRCKDEQEKNIIKTTYCGFIDNEKDMAQAINDTKIVYNINAQGVSSLNYRTIQTLACERLLISDDREELDLFNNIIPIWHNIDDLAQKIEYYLENKDEYNKITKMSREIIELNHDSKLCIKNMLKIIS